MATGKLALVLHAHLPYVRSATEGSLEEDWFFQALLECYLPLIEILEASSKAKEENPKLTISLSPTLLSLLSDNELKKRFPNWLGKRLELLENTEKNKTEAASHLSKFLSNQLNHWELCKGDLIEKFSSLQKDHVIDILTCAATHGYLPLLRENPEAVKGQLKTAIREHQRFFGIKPQGIWLPECAYYEGLDELMIEAQLRYSVLDGHGLLHGRPRPRYGIYAPICSKNGIAFFGRDSDATLPVWSAREGYPGDPQYREFHRDLGWDLSKEELKKIGIKSSRPLGLKLYKVSNSTVSLKDKEIYEPKLAIEKAKEHARDYLINRRNQLNKLTERIEIDPILVAPFDAELFGHWWFEGPIFIAEIFKQSPSQNIELTTLKEYLLESPMIQLCEPSPSSWGEGGFHKYWLNKSNSWVVNQWSKASKEMVFRCSNKLSNGKNLRILRQAARELLLSQSSDWSFILRAGTTTELAKERINRHLNRFWLLLNSLDNNKLLSESELKRIESEDRIFPLIHINDWNRD